MNYAVIAVGFSQWVKELFSDAALAKFNLPRKTKLPHQDRGIITNRHWLTAQGFIP